MISIKTQEEIETMRRGGAILAEILDQLEAAARPGVQTMEFDRLARELLASFGAKASFLGYNGFPATLCVSINEEVVHGLPSERTLKDGDVLKLDFGVLCDGYHTDSARTVIIGAGDTKKQKLLDTTRQALEIGIAQARAGNTIGDIGHAIETYVKSQGFDVVRDLIGHGIGKSLHEEPEVPNYGKKGKGPVLEPGMTIAIEPMVVEKGWQVKEGPDGFSYVTKDGGLAIHEEHTVAITEGEPLILTQK
ncbi:MAG TPA: type I methionyl aminopeptidase [Candidatus Paceibacterota bacterium]|nr:type I methionyl aminopeptidase [Candidatus Paceibacterota bacterium]